MIAVVGGRGFIGSAIVRRLQAAGLDVVTVTHSATHAPGPGFRHGDLLSPSSLPRAIEGAEVVIQSANFRNYPIENRRRGLTFEAFDARGTQQLVLAAQAAGARRYVFISGAGTQGGADKPYWNALRQGEAAVLGADLEGVCIEPTLVYGPEDRSVNRLVAFARRARFVAVIGSGEALHQPVFVDDIAELVYRSLAPAAPQGVFAIGGPDRLSLNDLLRRVLTVAGLSCRILHVPARSVRMAAAAACRLPGEPFSRAAVDFMLEDFVADVGPIESAFSLTPRSFVDCLSTYLPTAARAAPRARPASQ